MKKRMDRETLRGIQESQIRIAISALIADFGTKETMLFLDKVMDQLKDATQ